MKITNRLKVALKSILSISMGEIVTDKATLMWDGEGELAEGTEVFIKDENEEVQPAPDGDYKTEDGKTIKVAEGKVTEIIDPEAEVAPEETPAETPVEEVAVEQAEEIPAAEPQADPIEEPVKEEPVEEVTIEDRVAALEEVAQTIKDSLQAILNGIAGLESRLAVVEGKVAKIETEPAAEPVEEPAADEDAPKSKMSYLRKN